MADQDTGFLRRWSERKRAARREAAEPADREAINREAGRERAPDETAGPARPLAPAADPPPLPDPATLEKPADFRVFLGRDVPLETHQAALRRLWRLDPAYNRLDGLDDYCEDYTDQARVVKGLKTAYRVGKGMLEHLRTVGEETTAAETPAGTGAAAAVPEERGGAPNPGDDAPRPATDDQSSVTAHRPRRLPRRG